MLIDVKTEFGTALSFATEAGTTNVGDLIDLGTSGRSLGAGRPLYWVVQITTAADGGATNTGTLAFQLVSDSTSTVATDGTQTIHAVTDAFLFGQLTADTQFNIPIPSGITFEQFVGIQLVQAVEGEDDAIGNSFLVLDDAEFTLYADASN